MINLTQPPELFRLIPTGPEYELCIPSELLPMTAVLIDPADGSEKHEEVIACHAQIFERRTAQSDRHEDWIVTAKLVGADGVIAGYSRIDLPGGATGDFDFLDGTDPDELRDMVESGCLFVDFVDDDK